MTSIRPLSSAPSVRRIARPHSRSVSGIARALEEAPLRTRSYSWRATLLAEAAHANESARLGLSLEEDTGTDRGGILFDLAGSAFRLIGRTDAGSRVSFEKSREGLEALRDGLNDILARHAAP